MRGNPDKFSILFKTFESDEWIPVQDEVKL